MYSLSSRVSIRNDGITTVSADVVVNAANEHLAAGSGVCGYIFKAAGYNELSEACEKIGHCDTGNAVITLGFKLPANYIIHAVGPRWHGGNQGEAQLLYSCYHKSMELAMHHYTPSNSYGLWGTSETLFARKVAQTSALANKVFVSITTRWSEDTTNILYQ